MQPVDMVNNFFWKQVSTNNRFCHQSMFVNLPA